MNLDNRCIRKQKNILSISIVLLITAICVFLARNKETSTGDFTLLYETIDIKKMGSATVSLKKEVKDSTLSTVVSAVEYDSIIKEVTSEETKSSNKTQATIKPLSEQAKPTWRLPTEQGYITQYAHYNHIALDIASSRGTNERIYPVADGVISSIYRDSYGAKIVTVRHYINGQYYTSQYVHLSWYAYGIYVGQSVTTDTVLGGMGATGMATGIHLHLTVMDCNLYIDPHCANLGNFYNYGKTRVNQSFKGLDSLMYVPHSWYSR